MEQDSNSFFSPSASLKPLSDMHRSPDLALNFSGEGLYVRTQMSANVSRQTFSRTSSCQYPCKNFLKTSDMEHLRIQQEDLQKIHSYRAEVSMTVNKFSTAELSSCPAYCMLHPDATECSENVPAVLNTSNWDNLLLCSSYENSGKSPN